MFKKIMWYSILTIAVIGFATLSVAFFQAVKVTESSSNQTNDKVTKPSPISKIPNTISLVVMGDSIAKGTGDEKKKGFSGNLVDSFKNLTSQEILNENIGIDGLQSEGLLQQLQSNKLDSLIKNSDYIVISIGGNDVRSIRSLSDTKKENAFNTIQDKYLSNLKQILKRIRDNNKNTLIIFVGLYNPYESAGAYQDSTIINTWNYNIQQLLVDDERAVFIPTCDLFKFNIGRYVASDGFHPNSAGYEAISNRITQSVANVFNKK